jgi:hypothetical protein
MSSVKLTKDEIAALDFLIQVRSANAGHEVAEPASFIAAVAKVAKAATRYTPAVANVATAIIGADARAEIDPNTAKSLAELKSFTDGVSLEQLLTLRQECMKKDS